LITQVHLPPDQEEEVLRANLNLTGDPYFLGYIYLHLGHLGARRGRYPQAEKDYLKCVENFETVASKKPSNSAQRNLGTVLVYLADAMAADGQSQEAEPLYRRATTILDKLATDYPGIHLHRAEQAWAHRRYANLLKKLDRTADAGKAYRRAVELYEKLAADFSTVPAYRLELQQLRREAEELLGKMD